MVSKKYGVGEAKSVYLGMSREMHRAIRMIAASDDTTVPMLLKRIIFDFVVSRYPEFQQPDLTETSNREEG